MPLSTNVQINQDGHHELHNEERAAINQINEALQEIGNGGSDGREIQLQANATHIQWRYVGSTVWTNLVALSALTSPYALTGYILQAGQGTGNVPSDVPVNSLIIRKNA